jgi:hypothetical protein
MDTITLTTDQAGCWLDNHRGHYIGRDAIELAVEFGFLIGGFEKFAVDMYQDHSHEDNYPFEAMHELCDEAVTWLNSGQSECPVCGGTGHPPEGSEDYFTHVDRPDVKLCMHCSGTGRGDRVKFQNFPPKVPEGFQWAFEDGDFGLWLYDDEGNVLDPNEQEQT